MALTFSFFFVLFVFICLNVSGGLGSLPALLLMPLWQAEVRGFVRLGEPLCLPSVRRRSERQWGEGVCAAP